MNAFKEIGGYFELELPVFNRYTYSTFHKFNSARSALLCLIKSLPVKKIYLPKFICTVMHELLKKNKIPFDLYDIDENFLVKDKILLEKNEYLLYVNYFGLFDKNVQVIIKNFGKNKVIVDSSQAFFCPPKKNALATIYSPRKFFGVPDGGLLNTRVNLKMPEHTDIESFKRMGHLLKRLASSAEQGYKNFKFADRSISRGDCKNMSNLTSKLLASINYKKIAQKRLRNFKYLHSKLGRRNLLKFPFDIKHAPLCYPYLLKNQDTRDKLIKKKIYIPKYWPGLKKFRNKDINFWVDYIAPLPIDHRYNIKDMDLIIKNIKNG